MKDLPDKIAISWHIDDVLQQNNKLSKDDARKVLQIMLLQHDANIGINWGFIDACIDMYLDSKQEKS